MTTISIDTSLLLPYPKFYNILENNLCNQTTKKLKRITETEYELEREKYLNSADNKMLLYCLNQNKLNKHTLLKEEFIIVTEETNTDNDNKLFKKLPEACRILEIEYCNLPTLLKTHFKLQFGFHTN